MANVDRPRGFTPVRLRSGAPWSGAARPYCVLASDSTALFIGDPVVKTGSANTTFINGHLPGTLPTVARATAGAANQITGVVVAVEPNTADSLTYRAASTLRVVYVADDPELVFQCQDDGAGTVAADLVGLNANVVYTHAGSTATGRSGAEINGATWASDATFQFTLQGLARREGNEIADFATWEVTINLHTERLAAVAGL
jgi:hypothetical protein